MVESEGSTPEYPPLGPQLFMKLNSLHGGGSMCDRVYPIMDSEVDVINFTMRHVHRLWHITSFVCSITFTVRQLRQIVGLQWGKNYGCKFCLCHHPACNINTHLDMPPGLVLRECSFLLSIKLCGTVGQTH